MSTQQADQPAARALVDPLRRAAVIVRNLERSLTLYRDVLGLTLWKTDAVADNLVFFRLLGIEKARARLAILQGQTDGTGSEIGMVGLIEVSDPAPPTLRRPTLEARIGEVALVFAAREVDFLATRITALGLPIVCPPTRFEIPGGGIAREMTFRDFDGALVNLIQRSQGGGQAVG